MNVYGTWWRKGLLALGLVASLSMTGCASFYVDGATKDVPVEQYKKAEPAHAVQLVFEFQSKGVTNARATSLLKARVIEQVKNSGVFSAVSEAPVEGGAMLAITINNVPLTDDAFAKGFVTGLTFGLAGSTVTDGYVCTASYSTSAQPATIVKKARHAIHTSMGAGSAPANATKASNINDAVFVMTRQIVSNVLNDVTHDAAFQ
jgi:hypothetical protein